jgi:glycosyltransferase involved in cell wall biosynthesis
MGGAQRFLLTLLKGLDKSRFLPVVAAGERAVIPSEAAEGGRVEESLFRSVSQLNIRTITLKNLVREIRPIKDLKAFLEIRKLLKAEKPDILYLLSSKAGFLGALAGRFSHTPKTIYRIGGFAFHEHVSTVKQCLYFLAERISRAWKDIIIVNNHRDQVSAKKLGFSEGVIRYIPNGISSEQAFLSREQARRFFGIPAADLVLGTIANFYPNKGLADFLDALALLPGQPSLPPIQVIIIGDGKERPHLEQKIKDPRLGNVRLVGALPNASQYLKAFDLFVLPSRKEGMPWVILEAMLASVPIVATSVGGVLELLSNQENAWLVPPRNPKLLAEAINKALSDAVLRSVFAQHAKERVHRAFTVESMVKACEECFLTS